MLEHLFFSVHVVIIYGILFEIYDMCFAYNGFKYNNFMDLIKFCKTNI